MYSELVSSIKEQKQVKKSPKNKLKKVFLNAVSEITRSLDHACNMLFRDRPIITCH